jgi:hypothetical protein
MTKNVIANLPASVRAKLQNKAKETSRPFSEILQYYGMERFLYRLSRGKSADKMILKGALMFTVWDVPYRRTTLDIDFLAQYDNQIQNIEKLVKDICIENVAEDGIIFDPQTVNGRRIKEEAAYAGVRVKFTGFLEHARIPMQIDFGFDDVIYPKPKIIDYPVILDFPVPHLKGYPPESMISEKFEAMVKLGLLNSRMKDFYDIFNLIRQFDFKGPELVKALKGTFKHRKTGFPQNKLFDEEIYDVTSDRQTLWKAFIKKAEIEHAPETLSTTATEIEKFLGEALNAILAGDIFDKIWKAPGPWK